MSDRKIIGVLNWFATEVNQTQFKLSGASISITNGIATVTLASHLLTTGQLTTFSGVTGTGSTGLNAATWGPITVTSSGAYTFPVPAGIVSTSIGGTIVQEGQLYFPPAGDYAVNLGANGQLEYNPDNTYAKFGNGSGQDTTWRILHSASAHGYFTTDGISIRFRPNGTTDTSHFSQLE